MQLCVVTQTFQTGVVQLAAGSALMYVRPIMMTTSRHTHACTLTSATW